MVTSLGELALIALNKHNGKIPARLLTERQMLATVLAASVDQLQALVNDPEDGQCWLDYLQLEEADGSHPILSAKLAKHSPSHQDEAVQDLDELYQRLSECGVVGQNIIRYDCTACYEAITQLPTEWLTSPSGLAAMQMPINGASKESTDKWNESMSAALARNDPAIYSLIVRRLTRPEQDLQADGLTAEQFIDYIIDKQDPEFLIGRQLLQLAALMGQAEVFSYLLAMAGQLSDKELQCCARRAAIANDAAIFTMTGSDDYLMAATHGATNIVLPQHWNWDTLQAVVNGLHCCYDNDKLLDAMLASGQFSGPKLAGLLREIDGSRRFIPPQLRQYAEPVTLLKQAISQGDYPYLLQHRELAVEHSEELLNCLERTRLERVDHVRDIYLLLAKDQSLLAYYSMLQGEVTDSAETIQMPTLGCIPHALSLIDNNKWKALLALVPNMDEHQLTEMARFAVKIRRHAPLRSLLLPGRIRAEDMMKLLLLAADKFPSAVRLFKGLIRIDANSPTYAQLIASCKGEYGREIVASLLG